MTEKRMTLAIDGRIVGEFKSPGDSPDALIDSIATDTPLVNALNKKLAKANAAVVTTSNELEMVKFELRTTLGLMQASPFNGRSEVHKIMQEKEERERQFRHTRLIDAHNKLQDEYDLIKEDYGKLSHSLTLSNIEKSRLQEKCSRLEGQINQNDCVTSAGMELMSAANSALKNDLKQALARCDAAKASLADFKQGGVWLSKGVVGMVRSADTGPNLNYDTIEHKVKHMCHLQADVMARKAEIDATPHMLLLTREAHQLFGAYESNFKTNSDKLISMIKIAKRINGIDQWVILRKSVVEALGKITRPDTNYSDVIQELLENQKDNQRTEHKLNVFIRDGKIVSVKADD